MRHILARSGLLLPLFSLIVLGAHYFRQGDHGATFFCAGLLFFTCSRQLWHKYVVAGALGYGFFVWLDTARVLVMVRTAMDIPWGRGAVILVLVALFHLLAARWVLGRAKALAQEGGEGTALLKASTFLAVSAVLLGLHYHMSSLTFLQVERFFPSWGVVQVFVLAWYGGVVAGLLADPKQMRRTRRRIWLGFSVVFFAQLVLGVLGSPQFLMTGNVHVPVPGIIVFGPLYKGALGMMPFLLAASLVLGGSAWCSHLCYFGAWDNLCASRTTPQPLRPVGQLFFRYGRASVFVLGCVVALGLRLAGVGTVAAFSAAVLFGLGGVAVMLLWSRRQGLMMHCTCYCPIGFLVNSCSRFAVWRVRVNRETCTDCGACERVCRYGALPQAQRLQGRSGFTCSLCRECLAVCTHRALSLQGVGVSAERAQGLFVFTVVVLHTLFLSAARV